MEHFILKDAGDVLAREEGGRNEGSVRENKQE